MKISTKGRYGLTAMIDLAINSAKGHVPLCSIAERQNISEGYLEQMFSTLKKAGLVKSVKGPQGGYLLSQAPSEITVGTVLRVLEGSLTVVDEEKEKVAGNLEICIRKNVWSKIDESISKTVDSITLEDIAEEYNKIERNQNYMFFI